MEPKTYRVVRHTDRDLYIPSWLNSRDGAILDSWMDVDASTEEQEVSEYLVDASIADSFERLLNESPAIVWWEEVATGKRWYGRTR